MVFKSLRTLADACRDLHLVRVAWCWELASGLVRALGKLGLFCLVACFMLDFTSPGLHDLILQ